MADKNLSCGITETKLKSKEITIPIKIEMDTSEIVSNMKAIQRLSKSINQAMKEYENDMNKNLNNFEDDELINEIANREISLEYVLNKLKYKRKDE